MRSAIVLIAVFAVCLGSPRRPVPRHPNADLIEGALQRIGDSRIINGNDANIVNFPWQASLRNGNSHSCGASIISDRWLVSAAHCTQGNLGSYTVAVGETFRSDHGSGDIYNVEQIINHEGYGSGPGSYPNDISLIKLTQPLDLTGASVKAINLADSSDGDFSGKTCTISGWGRTSTGWWPTNLPDRLQRADTVVLSKSECISTWGSSINDGHVCVGGKEFEGACNGDSGGPLVCEVGGTKRLVGATSWGIQYCYTDYPSVYTRISHFRDWIRGKTDI